MKVRRVLTEPRGNRQTLKDDTIKDSVCDKDE